LAVLVDMAAVALVGSAVLADLAVAHMALARLVALLLAVLDLGRTALLVVSDVGVAEAMARCPTWALARVATRRKRRTNMSATEEISGAQSETSLASSQAAVF